MANPRSHDSHSLTLIIKYYVELSSEILDYIIVNANVHSIKLN